MTELYKCEELNPLVTTPHTFSPQIFFLNLAKLLLLYIDCGIVKAGCRNVHHIVMKCSVMSRDEL